MPSGNPPHKQNREGRASDQQRVEMVRKSIADNPHFRLSTEEMHPDGYTYTYETLERLHKKYPDQTFYFIIGADSLYDFDTWCRPDRICKAASLLVATRIPERTNVISGRKIQGEFYPAAHSQPGNFLTDTP